MCGFEGSGSHQLQGTVTGGGQRVCFSGDPKVVETGEEKVVTRWVFQSAVRLLQEARVPAAAGGRAHLRQLSREGAGMMEEAALPSPDTTSPGAQPGQARGCEGRRRDFSKEASWSAAENGVEPAPQKMLRDTGSVRRGSIASTPSSWSLAAWETTITNYYHKRFTSWESGGEGEHVGVWLSPFAVH